MSDRLKLFMGRPGFKAPPIPEWVREEDPLPVERPKLPPLMISVGRSLAKKAGVIPVNKGRLDDASPSEYVVADLQQGLGVHRGGDGYPADVALEKVIEPGPFQPGQVPSMVTRPRRKKYSRGKRVR